MSRLVTSLLEDYYAKTAVKKLSLTDLDLKLAEVRIQEQSIIDAKKEMIAEEKRQRELEQIKEEKEYQIKQEMERLKADRLKVEEQEVLQKLAAKLDSEELDAYLAKFGKVYTNGNVLEIKIDLERKRNPQIELDQRETIIKSILKEELDKGGFG